MNEWKYYTLLLLLLLCCSWFSFGIIKFIWSNIILRNYYISVSFILHLIIWHVCIARYVIFFYTSTYFNYDWFVFIIREIGTALSNDTLYSSQTYNLSYYITHNTKIIHRLHQVNKQKNKVPVHSMAHENVHSNVLNRIWQLPVSPKSHTTFVFLLFPNDVIHIQSHII